MYNVLNTLSEYTYFYILKKNCIYFSLFCCLFLKSLKGSAQKMKFSFKDFFSKCDKIRRKLQIWSHLLKKSLMENLFFCGVHLFQFQEDLRQERTINDSFTGWLGRLGTLEAPQRDPGVKPLKIFPEMHFLFAWNWHF